MEPKLDILISQEQLQKRIAELAQEIHVAYGDDDLVIIAVLSGCLYFLADLTRQLPHNQKMGLAVISSYLGATSSQIDPKIEYEKLPDIENKNVLIIDDIFDTGKTLVTLQKYLTKYNPKSINAAVLLDKQVSNLRNSVKMDFVGFTIPNKFVVGYGLDYDGQYRNLPYVAILSGV